MTRPDTTVLEYDYRPDGTLHRAFDGARQQTTYTYDDLARLSAQVVAVVQVKWRAYTVNDQGSPAAIYL